jgi:phosphatidyl-myo-inositol alpha-mannosyltransferase
MGGRALRLAYFNKLNHFDNIVSVSSAAQSYAKQTFGIDSKIIPNPINTSDFSKTSQKYIDGRIVFLGRLVKRKGCQQLLQAFAQLQTSFPETRLIVAGDGPDRHKLESEAQQLGIGSRVTFKGFIEETDKPELLASAHIACFPSLYGESFGIVLLEAMAADAHIVLGGNNPGYASVLQEQPELLVNPLDTAAFANRLSSLMTDEAKAIELNNWQREAVKKYDINIVGQQIVDMYLGAIAKRTKTRHNIGHGIPKSNG